MGRLRPSAQDNLREATTTRNDVYADTGRLLFRKLFQLRSNAPAAVVSLYDPDPLAAK